MIDWYLNLHPVHMPFVTLAIFLAVFIVNMLFWYVFFKAMKQIMIGMDFNVKKFFYTDNRFPRMKEVFQDFMWLPGYSVFWIIRWLLSQWMIYTGKAIKSAVK